MMSILNFIGIPYKIGSESYDAADCWGICRRYSMDVLGKELPKYLYSNLDNQRIAKDAIQSAHNLGDSWKKVVDTPMHGDIVTFRIVGLEIHCGIMLNASEFLHSLKGRGSCIEDLSHINWQHRKTGVFRYE
jgi:cell wall-associated NlpC family hydrolase